MVATLLSLVLLPLLGGAAVVTSPSVEDASNVMLRSSNDAVAKFIPNRNENDVLV